jgi:hypothetical protein
MRKGLILGLVFLSVSLAHSQSRVVVVWDTNAVQGATIDTTVVKIMMNAGIKALTDSTTVGGAWKSCFPGLTASQNISLKANCLYPLSSHPQVARAISLGLNQMTLGAATFRPWRFIVFERTDAELSGAGYTVRTDTLGMRCVGTGHAGWGYTTRRWPILDSLVNFSRVLVDSSSFLIDLCVLKDHGMAGRQYTLNMSNHYGTVSNANCLHPDARRRTPELVRVMRDSLGNKEKIYIIDALFAIYNGGPSGSPQVITRSLVLSKDPVACDSMGVEIINNLRVARGYAPKDSRYLAYAESIGLGHRAYTLIRINNPSAVELEPAPEGRPFDFALLPPRPNPFTGMSEIPFLIPKAGQARVEVFNALGIQVRTLTSGTRSAGQHTVIWDGRNGSGHKVASGFYCVRLAFGGASIERSLSLIR